MMAANGRTVVFQSFATDLIPGDYNDRRDVFVLQLGEADSDADGLDDGWEMAYFGTLARDGKADFDNDGQSDWQEFLAGTDPTKSGSVLRIMTLTVSGAGATKVIWSAAPGRSYQVEFKDNLSDSNWNCFPDFITASSTTASFLDNSSSADHRFYRVRLAP